MDDRSVHDRTALYSARKNAPESVSHHKERGKEMKKKYAVSEEHVSLKLPPHIEPFHATHPVFFSMRTENTAHPVIEICWNPGWPPYAGYVHIHDIYYVSDSKPVSQVCEGSDLELLLENFFDYIKTRRVRKAKGCYIMDWLYMKYRDSFLRMGFSSAPIRHEINGCIHICRWR